jgi:hypothetical protein
MTDAVLYGVMTSDGQVERVFDTVEEARTALYAMSAPVGKHPKLVQRVKADSNQAWLPVG